MKVIETWEYNNSDHDDISNLTVKVVNSLGKTASVTIGEGEPEDMYFFRDLSSAYSIAKLVELAYEAGKNGEDYDYELIEKRD